MNGYDAPETDDFELPQVRLDRVGILLDQLDDTVLFSRMRLQGLETDEFLWEPYPGMWSIRARHDARTPEAFGPGEFVLDTDRSIDPFDPGPISTIAWRIGHLVSSYAGRWEWTFGSRSIAPEDCVAFRPDASMVDQLWTEIDRWSTSIAAMTDSELDEPGFGQFPYGLDPQLPFIGIVRWMNRETIHHLAEVALLRDLYAVRNAG